MINSWQLYVKDEPITINVITKYHYSFTIKTYNKKQTVLYETDIITPQRASRGRTQQTTNNEKRTTINSSINYFNTNNYEN